MDNQKGSMDFTELFPAEFMKHYTQFESIDELLSSGGFSIHSQEDYDAIPDKDIDAHIKKTTNFNSWREMLINALETSRLLRASN
ncbi:hypothetical protein Desor_4099 [Desulfosporosinus orientis DSM 765]|uniref:Uncharacterized protein n=1 Tax=Desulfosporosinus orientis (strain ATCC 19365 / DSM 765 / NCIMB 8382 / VKM B-1628 / Singapore I) TaxID=768706 RepID=G7WH30_DESOD|nr:hypothetical protein [Desulfosporosinus orientis]AET69538.1 hypothetical protein Desor_4099 [Desulfosporosinus orientis DSM 765]